MVGSQVRCSCADRLVLKCTDCTEAARAGQPVRPTGWGNACAPTVPPAGLAQPLPPPGSANPCRHRAGQPVAPRQPDQRAPGVRVAISSVAVKSSPQPREWGRRQSQARGLADARYIGACIPVIIVRQCGPPSN
jgi:hypothetical protein